MEKYRFGTRLSSPTWPLETPGWVTQMARLQRDLSPLSFLYFADFEAGCMKKTAVRCAAKLDVLVLCTLS